MVAQEYLNNRDFYNDMIRFNCNNAIPDGNRSDRPVIFSNPPPEALGVIYQVYDKFKGVETSEIFRALGVSQTGSNKRSPVEAKWELVYKRKYGNVYDPTKRVSVHEILN